MATCTADWLSMHMSEGPFTEYPNSERKLLIQRHSIADEVAAMYSASVVDRVTIV